MAGNTRPLIGVLALQGDVREHIHTLHELGYDTAMVRTPADVASVDALVIPGGESSVIDKLSRIFGVRDSIVNRIHSGMPVLGTCAGLIMLADRITGGLADQQTFGGLDIVVERNAFGSQSESFETDITVSEIGDTPLHVAFIRGPVISSVGDDVTVLSTLPNGKIVGVRQGNAVGVSFHPEVTGETALHRWFVESVVVPSLVDG